ncbi:MAG: winged helix-turn-helix transcriptional regulator [Lachnospiraceae bacterium]|nr:winged helix-turn-helix transcriptional regulator [Lachnospiraceae bacterium]
MRDPIPDTNGAVPESLADAEELIELILINEKITQKDMAKETGFSLRKIKRLIAELKQKGRIVRVGNNRSGKWEVKEE